MGDLQLRFTNLKLESLHPATMALATAGTVTALSAAWIISDYRAWVAFGSGGTPPTPHGYWRMTKIRWHMYRSAANTRDASTMKDDGHSFLRRTLTQRKGNRPKIVSRTMPQRQVPERIEEAVRERVHALPEKFCNAHPSELRRDKSQTEGRSTDAVYARDRLSTRNPDAQDPILRDEIAHVHPAENSLHVWLSPKDAKQVVEKGWGERFPLTLMGITHAGLVMIYAPRTMEEVDVIEDIIRAGIEYVAGVKA